MRPGGRGRLELRKEGYIEWVETGFELTVGLVEDGKEESWAEHDRGMTGGRFLGSRHVVQVRGVPVRCNLWNQLQHTLHRVGLLVFPKLFFH